MISLKDSMRELDQMETLVRVSLEAYLTVVQGIRAHALEIVPEVGTRYHPELDALAAKLEGRPAPGVMQESGARIGKALESYSAEAGEAHRNQQQEVREILASVVEAARLLDTRNSSYRLRLQTFTGELEHSAKLEDLGEIRRRLRTTVTDLKSCIARMDEETAASVGQLEKELSDCRSRLAQMERIAFVDSLTGVGNRREGERQLLQRMESRAGFCLVVAAMNRFGWVNERYGPACGDELLKLFAERLQSALRPSEVLCRWRGDEFVLLLECGLPDAMRRTFQLGPRLRGRYSVPSVDKGLQLDVGARLGVAEYVKGETLEQLWARAASALRAE